MLELLQKNLNNMKHLITTALLFVASMTAIAAEYQPSEGWSYIFPDFKEAIVYYNNNKAESARVNVHLGSNTLHFTDGEKMMIVKDAQYIDSVVCSDGEKLLRRGNLYVRTIIKSQYVVIGRTQECDFNQLTDNNGAYGTSTVTGSAQNYAAFEQFGNVAAYRYKDMMADRRNTRSLPTIDRTVMIVNDRAIVHATKREVSELLSKEQKKDFNKFLKENKVKWKDIAGLLLVAQYLDALIQNGELEF